ncbi:MAG: GldG family protein [Elusimicrobia bacterium]|nr:GldG family protein [Elusimicrobiota bacterium]
MDRRRLLETSSAGVALVLAVAMMINVLGHFVHARLDLSQGRVYSMSAASRRVLRGLPDPVEARLYFSKELPPQVASTRDYARDLLDEYRSAAGRKMRVRLIEVDSSNREEAMRDGIAPVRFDIIARDKYEQRDGYFGLVLQYHDKKETFPFLQDVSGLEYDLTSRIKTMTLAVKPSLAFITSHRSVGPGTLDGAVREKLESRYQLKPLDLAAVPDDGIPPDIQTMMLIGPQEKFSERELWLLDQYLASGRSLGLAFDAKRVELRSFFATDNDTGLTDWLAKHGIKVLSTVVLDRQCQPIQVSMSQGLFMMTNVVQYPPFVVASDLSAGNPITKGLNSVVLPFASPLELAVKGASAKAEILVRSTKYSWAKPDKTAPIILNPFQLSGPGPADLKGPFGLAAAVENDFDPVLAQPKTVKAKNALAKAARPGRLAVVGTSKIVSESFRVPSTNYVFLLNMMDWLALDADLIAIRSKAVGFRPLAEIPAGGKALVRYALIFVPPMLAVGLGLLRWRARRKACARRVAEFGEPSAAPPAPAPAEPDAPETVGAPPQA